MKKSNMEMQMNPTKTEFKEWVSGCKNLEFVTQSNQLKRISKEIGHILKGTFSFESKLFVRVRYLEENNALLLNYYACGLSFSGVSTQFVSTPEILNNDCSDDCYFGVDSVSFFKIIDSLGDSEVKIRVEEREVTIRQNKKKVSLPRLDSEDYTYQNLPLSIDEIRHSLFLKESVLREGIRVVGFSRSSGMSRPNLEIVELEVGEKEILFSASDGQRLSRFRKTYNNENWGTGNTAAFGEIGNKFQLTNDILQTISKVTASKTDRSISIYNLNKFLVLSIGDAKYYAPYLDLPFPELTRVIPTDEPKLLFNTLPSVLLDKLEAFKAIGEGFVVFRFKNSNEWAVHLVSEDLEGKFRIEDELSLSGEVRSELTAVKLNLTYLQQALKTFNPNDEISISQSDSLSPVKIIYASHELQSTNIQVIMPIRLDM